MVVIVGVACDIRLGAAFGLHVRDDDVEVVDVDEQDRPGRIAAHLRAQQLIAGEAAIDGVLRAERADRVLDLDVVIVDRARQPAPESGPRRSGASF